MYPFNRRKILCEEAGSFFIMALLMIFFLPNLLQAKSNILKESLATIQAKALKGDVYYQGALGLFYKTGEHGLPIDMEEAMRWSKMAANKEGALGLATLAAIELENGKTERGTFYMTKLICTPILEHSGKKKKIL